MVQTIFFFEHIKRVYDISELSYKFLYGINNMMVDYH